MIIKWLFRRSVRPSMLLDLCAWFLAVMLSLSALRTPIAVCSCPVCQSRSDSPSSLLALFSLWSRCFTGHRCVHVVPLCIYRSATPIPSSSCYRASFLTNNTSGISCHVRRFIRRAFNNSRIIAGYSLNFPWVKISSVQLYVEKINPSYHHCSIDCINLSM